MSDRDDFLAWVRSDLRHAEVTVHDGDAGPRREVWSRTEPVTLFGAVKSATGRAKVDELFTLLEGKFSGCRSYDYEVVAAEVVGDLAYTAGYERTRAVVDREERTYTLRVTQVYRREDAGWRVVHRHGDSPPDR